MKEMRIQLTGKHSYSKGCIRVALTTPYDRTGTFHEKSEMLI